MQLESQLESPGSVEAFKKIPFSAGIWAQGHRHDEETLSLNYAPAFSLAFQTASIGHTNAKMICRI